MAASRVCSPRLFSAPRALSTIPSQCEHICPHGPLSRGTQMKPERPGTEPAPFSVTRVHPYLSVRRMGERQEQKHNFMSYFFSPKGFYCFNDEFQQSEIPLSHFLILQGVEGTTLNTDADEGSLPQTLYPYFRIHHLPAPSTKFLS